MRLMNNETLFSRVRVGDKRAINELITSNLDVVSMCVREFIATYPLYKYLQDDLTSGGLLALVRAVDCLSRWDDREVLPTAYIKRAIRNGIYDVRRQLTKPVPVWLAKPEAQEAENDELLEEILACCKTDTERDIVQYRSESLTNDEIGDIIGISGSLVSYHLGKVRKRFDLRTQKDD